MVFWIFGLLCLSQTCTAVFIDGLDCSLDCVCCKGGEDHCGYDFGTGRKYCFDGCVDGIYGHRCHNPCPGNCSKCEQVLGKQCYSCKSTFYDIDSDCSKICSVGCDGGVCYVDGKCDTCLPGKYGSHCTLNCTYQNCRCTNGTDCTSCRKGFFGRSTFCQNPCSPGCQDGVCNDDGSCNCRGGFTDNTCSECQAGYYGIYCNISCSVGCVNKSCSKDGTCLCRPNFETSVDGKCETCIPGKYGSNCTLNCTNKNCRCTTETDCISCKKGFFDRSTFCQTPCSLGCQDGVCNDNGSCNCRYGTCIQYECQSGYYGTYCNISCSVGCVNGTCSKDGTCSCRQNFFKEKCNACANGRYDVNCDHIYTSEKVRPHIGAFVGGVSSGIVVIIGIVVALLLFRQRSNSMPAASQTKQNASANERTRFNERQTTYTQLQLSAQAETASENEIYLKIDNESIEALNNGSDDPTYCNEHGTWSKIPIAQLVKYMDGKSHEAFSAEFEIFSHCSAKSYVESQKRENISKNRYKGIYPYDDSRVKVTGSVGSDYINASFIDGYKRPKQYIATLGPMSQQLGDFSLFWKMLWQQKVEKIAMVTNLIERGSHKCEQYWPNPGTTQMFDDIKVESRSEDEYAEFTRRTFTLTMGTEERTLCHLQFTCWPDKAIPDDVTELIEFRQRVQSTPSTLNGPTVVHCSAGVGRTGIYIALDILTEEGEVERAIDILGCVHTIRRNRPNMVQTLEQYKFLHTAVLYSLTFDCSQVKGDNFNHYMKTHSIQELNSQFKRLQHTVKTRCKEEIEAVDRNEQHRNKNRASADIPGDENRPRLYLGLKPGATDYINAVYIHSFIMKKRYLVAQTPLPETVIDFLTLAVQERCSCIVSLEADMDIQKDIGIYYPAANQDVLEEGTFKVNSSREEKSTFYVERTLTIQHKGPGMSTDRNIPHLQFTDWDQKKNIPKSTANFLSFLNVIERVTKKQEYGPILVHCFDGAGKSGLFCAVSLLLHKMAMEHEVSVLNAVRKVKTTRWLAIPNQEQFVFCHECVSEYLSSFYMYANFNEERR